VDDHVGALGGEEHDELEEIRGAVRTDDEPSIGVIAEILDGESVLDGMEHFVVRDAVSSGTRVDLHTRILYYRNIEERPWMQASREPAMRGRWLSDVIRSTIAV
jgi:hypothetical protein